MRTLALVLASVVLLPAAVWIYTVASFDKEYAIIEAQSRQPIVAYSFLARLLLMSDCEGIGDPASPLEFALGGLADDPLREVHEGRVRFVADLILRKGCDTIDGRGSIDLTHLQGAVFMSDTNAVRYLLSRGADPTITATHERYRDLTPLEIAKKELVLARDKLYGENAHHYARKVKSLEEIIAILEHTQSEI